MIKIWKRGESMALEPEFCPDWVEYAVRFSGVDKDELLRWCRTQLQGRYDTAPDVRIVLNGLTNAKITSTIVYLSSDDDLMLVKLR